MKKFIIFTLMFNLACHANEFDLSLVGFIVSSDGLGKIPLLFIDCLKNLDVKINFIPTQKVNLISPDTPLSVQRILNNDNSHAGKVAIYTDIIAYDNESHVNFVPKNSFIKLAYSMLEGTQIPQDWVNILNNNFDAVLVPDDFLVKVYKSSGVKIPIFVLPLIVNLEKFLSKNKEFKNKKSFVFGNTCAIGKRKNFLKLVEAFNKAFNGAEDIFLKINARDAYPEELKNLKNKISSLNNKNITLDVKILSQDQYLKFMLDMDCYISLSCGEGFSIPPREALGLSIPVILSDNSAHRTICKTGFVRPVVSNIKIPFFYDHKHQAGHSFDCNLEDAILAFKDVYENYSKYVQKAKLGKEWVKQYLMKNLEKKYLNACKPKKVLFGNKNMITDDYLMTDSKSLFNKYNSIIKNNFERKFRQKTFESISNMQFINHCILKNNFKLSSSFNPFVYKNFINIDNLIFKDFNHSMKFERYRRNKEIIYNENDIKRKLKLYKKIYEKNKKFQFNSINRIPKIIHQIWLGDNFPNEFKKITDKWIKMHPDWEYVLWDDNKIKELLPLYNQKYFDESNNLAEKSDILRYEILYRYGGLYVDTDYECIKNFDCLINKYDFFAGIQPLDASAYDVGNAIIGSCAKHPIIKCAIESIANNRNEHMLINRTGPGHLTRSILETANFFDKDIMIFPVSYLYPLGYFERNKKMDPKNFLYEESFGIHYWSGSWYLKN